MDLAPGMCTRVTPIFGNDLTRGGRHRKTNNSHVRFMKFRNSITSVSQICDTDIAWQLCASNMHKMLELSGHHAAKAQV